MRLCPPTLSTPLSESAPPAVTVRSPLSVIVPRSSALLSLTTALAALMDKAPTKSLALSRVMLWPAALMRLWPPTLSTPLSLTVPPAMRLSSPLSVIVPRSSALLSLTVALAALMDKAPTKLLALSSTTL